jgi:hypothetical protein
LLGSVLAIINNYASAGSFESDKKPATFRQLVVAIGPALAASLLLTWLIIEPTCTRVGLYKITCTFTDTQFKSNVGSLAIGMLPTILGFGIGVYALLFALSKGFVNDFQKHAAAHGTGIQRPSALMLNSTMAFPLVVILITIMVAVFQQGDALVRPPSANPSLSLSTWILLWMSLISTLDLISSLFRIAEHTILDKMSEHVSDSGPDPKP